MPKRAPTARSTVSRHHPIFAALPLSVKKIGMKRFGKKVLQEMQFVPLVNCYQIGNFFLRKSFLEIKCSKIEKNSAFPHFTT